MRDEMLTYDEVVAQFESAGYLVNTPNRVAFIEGLIGEGIPQETLDRAIAGCVLVNPGRL